jgi:hypothetical protein
MKEDPRPEQLSASLHCARTIRRGGGSYRARAHIDPWAGARKVKLRRWEKRQRIMDQWSDIPQSHLAGALDRPF